MHGPLWISAAEFSGDMHGADLVTALAEEQPECSFIGMGGARMEEAGVQTLFRAEDLSVMGIVEVLGHIPKIIRMLRQIRAAMIEHKPKALIVIDAPDFHFRVITIARDLGIPVYYYISPKVWAWRKRRVHFIKKNVRRVISILPFEVPFYTQFGVDIEYVGNPLVDTVNYESIKHIQPIPGRIGLMPGSRKKEVTSLMPAFGGAAQRLYAQYPHLRFVCLCAPSIAEGTLRALWPEGVPLTILQPDNRWAAMRECEMLVAASGTVTLESALAGVPTLVTYKVSPFSYAIGRCLLDIPFISLPNLIAEKGIFPELIQSACDADPLAVKIEAWMENACKKEIFAQLHHDMDAVRQKIGNPGAAKRAAAFLLRDIALL